MSQTPPSVRPSGSQAAGLSERDVLLTLFDLGRQVASVIVSTNCLQRIQDLIRPAHPVDAFAVTCSTKSTTS
jgi:hypothetical protein